MTHFHRPNIEAAVDDILCQGQDQRSLQLNIEISGCCNLRCHYCSLDRNARSDGKSFMSRATLNAVFDLVLNNPAYQVTGKVCLWNGGEPLLHPDLPAMISILAKPQKPAHRFAIITNATRLTPALSELILDSNVFSEIVFSLDGGTPTLFEQMRPPAKWDQVYTAILDFLALRKKKDAAIKTSINMVLDPTQDRVTLAPQFSDLVSRVDSCDQNYPFAEAGFKPADYVDHYPVSNGLCAWIKSRQYVVLWNGQISMCCSDLNGKMILGSLDEFDSIYAGNKRQHYLRAMLKQARHQLSGCQGCNQPEILPTSDGSGFWDSSE